MKNFSLNAKISFIIVLFLVGSIFMTVLAASRLQIMDDRFTAVIGTLVPRLTGAMHVSSDFRQLNIYQKNMILENDPSKIEAIQKSVEVKKGEFQKQVDYLISIASVEGRPIIEEMKAKFEEWLTIHDKIYALAIKNRDSEAAQLSMVNAKVLRDKIDELMEGRVQANLEKMKVQEANAHAESQSALTVLISTSAIILLLSSALAFFVMASLTRSINRVIESLSSGADQVTSASQQIASASQDLSQSATEQAASLEETSASVEQMSSMIQKNSDNAKKTAEVATSSHTSALRGKDVVESMIRAIQDINTSNNEISEIVKVIGEIGNKTKVINDIVFQTKLLSFNASIEAARAGEHGKGFAVVAEEVGNLAEMSGNAAKEISDLLEGSIQKVERLVTTSKEKVETGTQVASDCGGVLEEIVLNVQSVKSMAEQISTASEEQAQGIQEITKAMSQLDQVTQQNAASSEQAASSAEELSGQSESMRVVVNDLVVAVKGGVQASAVTSMVDQAISASSTSNSSSRSLGTPSISKTKTKGRLIHLKSTSGKTSRSSTSSSTAGQSKMAVGTSTVPSADDAGFEEV